MGEYKWSKEEWKTIASKSIKYCSFIIPNIKSTNFEKVEYIK